MKVQDVMSMSVATCSMQDSLQTVAQQMWEHDCGCLPVVDGSGRPVAMITDRDVCMAAFTTGKPLGELRVAGAMSKQVVTCRAQEDLAAAGQRMSKHAIRRLPVVDGNGKLSGMLSLNDLACAIADGPATALANTAAAAALRVLESVSQHRAGVPAAPPKPEAPSAAGRETPA